MSSAEVINNLLEVDLNTPDHFLVIKETLTRIGVLGKDNTVYQSCHLLHKRGKYYIVHFLEMFALDGKETTISSNDIARRNTIALLLQDWNLLKVKAGQLETVPANQLKIVSFKDKRNYTLVPKYTIGKRS